MVDSLQTILFYVSFPVVATVVGGIVATFYPPGPRLSSGFQHLAAGVVFAAAASELLPQISAEHRSPPVILGFLLGLFLMLGVKWALEHTVGGEGTGQQGRAGAGGGSGAFPAGLVVTVGVDILIDGLLIGAGFAAGEEVGFILTVALTLELLFLGLSTAAALNEDAVGRAKSVGTVAGLGLLALVGAVAGSLLLGNLSGGALDVVLAFGVAALLYLVTEELLVEAHEREDTPWVTALFFIGFLVLFVLE